MACRWLVLWTTVVLVQGCATPAARFARQAERFGMEREVVTGREFRHVVFFKPGAPGGPEAAAKDLHVYLDGDGSPWVDPRTVAFDPTPTNPLILRLMAMDPAPAVLLGRPCTLGLAGDPGCSPYYWTQGRYSPAVVMSLVTVLTDQVRRRGEPRLTLVGFSGGGTLAMLVAGHVPQVDAVVTLGANLDIDLWTERHGYSPLTGSLNPATQPPLDVSIRQLHCVGVADRNVDPATIAAFSARQPNAHFLPVAGCTHDSGWESHWPVILRSLLR